MLKRDLRIIFMGTPEFAVPSLKYLWEAGYPIVSVITAPDRMGGRGMKQTIISPVKQFAIDHSLPVLQPPNLKSPAFLDQLRELKADLQVVVAFRMLPESVWSMPQKGTINLHGSLLPAYRGAAPIQRAIMAGEMMTGVTTFFLQQEIDTGEILLQREIPILPDDNAGSLHDRMKHIGPSVVIASVDLIQSGKAVSTKQDNAKASHAPKIHHADGHIDWGRPAVEIHNLVRALSPYPGAWTILDEKEVKIFKTKIVDEKSHHAPGTITVHDRTLYIQSGHGIIEVLELQMQGKKRMKAVEFLNGYAIRNWLAT